MLSLNIAPRPKLGPLLDHRSSLIVCPFM